MQERGAIVEQHTAAPLRYIPHRNGFNELSRINYTVFLSEQSIVYGTRHRPDRRAGLYLFPLPRNRRADTKTNKSRKEIRRTPALSKEKEKKKPSTATLRGMTQFWWSAREIGMLISIIKVN